MADLADTPEAPALAAPFDVPPQIHAADMMYDYHLGQDDEQRRISRRPDVLRYYFSDGADSARRLDELVKRYHPDHAKRRLDLLEFAAGYGRVSRHLAKMPHYALTACDIHEQAVAFLSEQLHVDSLLSHADPQQLQLPRRYDLIFALSFFTHIRTWSEWFLRLFDALADGGLLIFTTHGRVEYMEGGSPPLEPDGHWFGGTSEQKDLPASDYLSSIVTPYYVLAQIELRDHAALALFQESFWWDRQDTWVVRKVSDRFGRTADRRAELLEAESQRLREEIARLRGSTSWRLTAPMRALGRMLGRR